MKKLFGEKYNDYNGIDFSKHSFRILDKERVIRLDEEIVQDIQYYRCLNLEIMIVKDGNPHQIEINLRSMGVWAYQFNTVPHYGEYTDEVIDCVKNHLKELNSKYLLL